MKKALMFVVLGLTSSYVLSAPELKGSPEDLRGFLYPIDKVVTINGAAEEKAYSDKAIISLVITTENKLLAIAISSNSKLREKITTSLKQSGISADRIKSSKFSSSPQYGWFGTEPTSYKVVNRMAISIMQEAHLTAIATVADNHAQAELSDTTFEHTKKDEFNERVKAKALAKIIKQKKYYEKSLALKLTPIGIRESKIQSHATRGAKVLEEILAARRDEAGYSSTQQSRGSSFDELRYEVSLSVDFKMEN